MVSEALKAIYDHSPQSSPPVDYWKPLTTDNRYSIGSAPIVIKHGAA